MCIPADTPTPPPSNLQSKLFLAARLKRCGHHNSWKYPGGNIFIGCTVVCDCAIICVSTLTSFFQARHKT